MLTAQQSSQKFVVDGKPVQIEAYSIGGNNCDVGRAVGFNVVYRTWSNGERVYQQAAAYTRPVNFRRRYYRIFAAAGIERKGLHSIRHTFATNLVNGVKQPDGTIRSLTPRQVADLLGHSTSEITEMYYVKKDTARLGGITEGFEF